MSPARHRRRVNVRRRRRVLAALLIVAGVSTLWVTRSHGPATTTTVTTSSSTAPSTTTTSPFPSAVARTTVVVTEPATANLAARSLLTVVRYPALGSAPLRAHAPYPLVVFSQGYGVAPEAYVHLLNAWAAAGYVVADPAYPFTSVNSPGGLVRSDIVNHPHDLSEVITTLIHDSAGTGVLSGLIDPTRIAVIGHSDGGDVALAAVANDCCRDPRIKAAILLSGAELAWFPGKYFTTSGVPMLVVQGSIDYDLNPVPCSVALYNVAPRPKYYLSMIGQTHYSAYLPPGRALNVVTRTTIDFLNAYLRHSSTALRSMISSGDVAGLATLTSQVPVPAVAGTCPDSPVG